RPRQPRLSALRAAPTRGAAGCGRPTAHLLLVRAQRPGGRSPAPRGVRPARQRRPAGGAPGHAGLGRERTAEASRRGRLNELLHGQGTSAHAPPTVHTRTAAWLAVRTDG